MSSECEIRYPSALVAQWARGLAGRMTMERASRMCGVSAGQVARWRDGAPLTDRMLCAAAVGMTADDNGMVGTFGRVDTGGVRFSARVVGSTVTVAMHESEVPV